MFGMETILLFIKQQSANNCQWLTYKGKENAENSDYHQ